MDGVLVIDKPRGPTSHDVVIAARRMLRERRVGHTGTLDPLATGVLPLVIGRATRLASLLSNSEKEYEAAIRLGAATASYDAAERAGLQPPAPPAITMAEVDEALTGFRGTFLQTPPPFSAKKVAGVPAYELARSNRPAELQAVEVTVSDLLVVALHDGLLRVTLAVSSGFYVRSLAHDLGQRLGCGGYLEALRRTRVGQFTDATAVALEQVDASPELAADRLVPLSELAPELATVTVNDRGAKRARHGNPLEPRDLHPVPDAVAFASGVKVRVMDEGRQLLGIAIAGPDGLLRPSIVLV